VYEDYSGAFCALTCLRSALAALKQAVARGQISRVRDHAREAEYFADEFQKRRASARAARRRKA
jgi:hypothetical protein